MGVSYDALYPDLLQGMRELQQWLSQQRILTTITSTVRTYREQKFLWDRYQKGEASFPAAPPGHSAHEYGWAFDMIVSPSHWLPQVGVAWEEYWGGTWGGHKSDPVHFELPGASQLAWQLGEQGATPAPAAPERKEGVVAKVYDVVLGFVPVYGTAQLVASISRLAPGLDQSTILDWIANPGKYPELTFLQELVTIL